MEEQNNVALQSDPRTRPMTFGDWMITLLLLMIPFAGTVLAFIWAFSDDVNISKRNFFRAGLVLSGIFIGLYIIVIIFVLIAAGIGSQM